ncbi:phosphoribosylformylglycinamidine cyclo-ligase [Candidatus Methanophagaceae archaeon]|nr:phosphoribosylformylglycinamidine cyclo-ligase [Methanophagales archaeon]
MAWKVVEGAGLKYTDPFSWNLTRSIGKELLIPTRIYTEVLELLKNCKVHGLAHITGSGYLKLLRITDLGFDIYKPLEPNPVFKFLQETGNISDIEMYKTFNMGMGFAAVIPAGEEAAAARITGGEIVGKVVEKEKGLSVGDLNLL